MSCRLKPIAVAIVVRAICGGFITAAPPVNIAISSTPQQGSAITAPKGTSTSNQTSFTYQSDHYGHHKSVTVPVNTALQKISGRIAADVGHHIAVTGVAISSSGPSAPATSAMVGPVVAAVIPLGIRGVHLSGGEYNRGPGAVYGSQYIYPSDADLDYFKSKRFNSIRLAMDIYRLQPTNNAPLSTSELALITPIVEHAQAIGMTVVLDPHSYGEMWCTANNDFEEIGLTPCITNAVFADFWARMATAFKSYPNVMYNLMNEPKVHTASQWKTSAVAAINAIRAITTSQTILIPGACWTEPNAWSSCGNDVAWAGYTDPAGGPFAFDFHQYLNTDGSARPFTCTAGTGHDFDSITTWLAANNFKGFLGEFGWPNAANGVNAQCQTEGIALVSELVSHKNQWLGWDWCCSGPWAGDNHFNLYPGADGVPGDQIQVSSDPIKSLLQIGP